MDISVTDSDICPPLLARTQGPARNDCHAGAPARGPPARGDAADIRPDAAHHPPLSALLARRGHVTARRIGPTGLTHNKTASGQHNWSITRALVKPDFRVA